MADPGLTDEQARALFQRAAELQAAAEHAATRARAFQPVQEGDLSVEQLTAAAEGAGIDAEFVRIAVAEQQLPDAEDLRHDSWQGRWLQRVVQEPNVIERERIIPAPPDEVLPAFRTVAASAAYQLLPESTVGSDPLRDTVFVYRLSHSTAFSTTMNFADARVLLVTVRPHERGAIVRIRVPLFRRALNLGLSGFSAALFGSAGGGALGWGAVALGASAVLAAAPVAAGVAAGGAFGFAGFRTMYRSATKQAATAIDMLLQAVAVEAGTTGH